MYRDILLSNNDQAPPVQAQGWYTDTSSKWDAVGENVLEAAYEAWNATQPSDTPLDPTHLDNPPVEGFAIGKHGALIGGHGDMKNKSLHKGDFGDGVVLIHQYDEGRSTATVEGCAEQRIGRY